MRRNRLATLAGATLLILSVGCTKGAGGAPQAEDDKTIRIGGSFRNQEQARFEEVVRVFNERTGYNVVYEATPDFTVQIQVQVAAGTAPDIAALPQPGAMHRLAAAGDIKPLPADVVAAIDANYAPVWRNLGSYDGQVYGVFHRVNAKSFVWYNKKEWERRGYSIPRTWAELEQLEDQMAADGIAPWSIGFEAGVSSGWAGTDWLEDMMLRTAGADTYDKWVAHEISFDDPAVVAALKKCGEIFLNDQYVLGGHTNIITQNYGDSIRPLFENPPTAMMNRQGNFIIGFMQEQVQEHMDEYVGVFALPGVNPEYGTPVLGGGDQFVIFNDRPGVKDFILFLTTWDACAPWAHIGGALFPHKTQNFDDYGNSIERELAQILVNASVFSFDASDLMPSEVGSGSFWTGMMDYVSGAVSAEECLRAIDETWPRQ